MLFSAKEDIAAPIEHVYLAVTDFDGFERQALRRGADVQRKGGAGAPGVGTEWRAKFTFRGKERVLNAQLTELDPPNGFRSEGKAGGLSGNLVVELVALSPKRTRLQVSLELEARSLAGRLLIQSLKFARGNLNRRFDKRIAHFAAGIEDKYKQLGSTA